MKDEFDAKDFRRQIRAAVSRAGTSMREAARSARVDSATFCRAMQGKPPSVETYLRLVKWMKGTTNG